MHEQHAILNELEETLNSIEKFSSNKRYYQTVTTKLELLQQITAPIAENLLLLCIRETDDLKQVGHVTNIISLVLKKIKDEQSITPTNLLPSALAVLNILQRIVFIDYTESVKKICFEIIISYPENILITLCVNHSDLIFEHLNVYCDEVVPADIRVQSLNIVAKLLKILPPDKRAIFVKDGVKVWFSKVIPLVIQQIPELDNSSYIVTLSLDALELLTDELVQVDYEDNEEWKTILVDFHSPNRYPELMKTLLNGNNEHWHRLWIVFIKLLKTQITKCNNTSARPINVLLPCVELAFKLDIKNRCRAFLCWNTLIENFSKETNETFLKKMLRLLIVPLSSNNAKVEELAFAKFKTWWCLIKCFQNKMNEYLHVVTVDFLTFCFGKPKAAVAIIPGQLSDRMRIQCAQAFINLIGHYQCEGCVQLSTLNVQYLNAKVLASDWRYWIHALGSAIRICVEHDREFSEKHIKCVWKSFILTIGEMPANNVRRDLFNEVLILLDEMTENCDNKLMNGVVNVLIPPLFDTEDAMQTLLKLKDENSSTVHKLIKILIILPLDNLENRKSTLESIQLLTELAVDDAIKTSSSKLEWLVKSFRACGALLWTALADSTASKMYTACPRFLSKMLLWPFTHIDNFATIEESTKAWHNFYTIMSPYLKMTSINDEIVKELTTHTNNESSCVFVLSAIIAVSAQKLKTEAPDCNKEIMLILKMTNQFVKVQMALILPPLVDVIVHMLINVTNDTGLSVAENIIFIINNILKICNLLFNKRPAQSNELIKYIAHMFQFLESTLILKLHSELKLLLVNELKECAPYLKYDISLKSVVDSIYKIPINYADNIVEEVVHAFNVVEESDNHINTPQEQTADACTSSRLNIKKKSNKQASITNTVIENGEEFAVIKSNWKFNPRKLTDNQKEKLGRKREDIPALYQDLSQSQDEYNLTAWKTDSQDTTSDSTSTNIPANVEVSGILKNVDESDFRPKILENIIIKPATNITVPVPEMLNIPNNDSEYNHNSKSPRKGLRDRIIINVRTLEKYNIGPNCTVNANNTPKKLKTRLISKEKQTINSLPSRSSPERPSRLKRKPKKFDDLELIPMARKRHSLTTNDSLINVQFTDDKKKEDSTKNEVDVKSNVPINRELIENSIEYSSVSDIEHQENEKTNVDSSCIKVLKKSIVKSNVPINRELIENSIEYSSLSDIENQENEKTNVDSSCIKVLKKSIVPTDVLNRPLVNETDTECLMENFDSPTPTVNEINENKEIVNYCVNSNIAQQHAQERCEKKNEEIMCTDTLERETEENISTVTNSKCLTPEDNKKQTIVLEKTYFAKCKTNEVSDDNEMKKKIFENSERHNVDVPNNEINEKIEDHVCVENNNALTNETTEESIRVDSNTIVTVSTSIVDTTTVKQTLSNKKPHKKKSRIESQLAIDMVEGHPFLNTTPEHRSTRNNTVYSSRTRKRCSDDSDNIKQKKKATTKVDNSINNEDSLNTKNISASQDFIESSQDSTATTISVKSFKPIRNSEPVVVLSDIILAFKTPTANGINVTNNEDLTVLEASSDIELPCNKTNLNNVTEEMDTELYVIELSDDDDVNSEEFPSEHASQNTANADTQPIDADIFLQTRCNEIDADTQIADVTESNKISDIITEITTENIDTTVAQITATEDAIESLLESAQEEAEKNDSNSSFNNEQGKVDFLNNTLQISPIKSMSPIQNPKSPLLETSRDYVVINLASPVQSNGDPYELCESPEIFTDDKLSPDNRDRSPPREVVCITNTSPKSLSLKKNKPQMRPGGRAAQMLGLCVPVRVQTMLPSEKPTETEETNKITLPNTSARRNLKILYNSCNGVDMDNSENSEDSENFLKFRKVLPSAACSPSAPILKRKLIDITDETTASPASKRKRVSFLDPPVSTTKCVKKYLEPISSRSPQNSVDKRQKRSIRGPMSPKSPRRLDNVFKLDSVLNKAVESFSEENSNIQNQNQDIEELSSLDDTPVVEVIRNSDLNDMDPICKELVDCEDPITNVAAELSSPVMKDLLIKDLEGKVETIGDLAKMTELDINRLCIKSPKVEVAKAVLNDYLLKVKVAGVVITRTVEAAVTESTVEPTTNVEIQITTSSAENVETQTEYAVSAASSQTDGASTTHAFAQTEGSDLIESLCENLDVASKLKIVENVIKISNEDSAHVLSFLQEHLIKNIQSRDLMLFCSSLIKNVYDKPA